MDLDVFSKRRRVQCWIANLICFSWYSQWHWPRHGRSDFSCSNSKKIVVWLEMPCTWSSFWCHERARAMEIPSPLQPANVIMVCHGLCALCAPLKDVLIIKRYWKKNILISSQSLTHLSRMCDYVIFLGREVCSMSNNARIVHSISSTCGWIRTTWKHRPMPNKNCVMGSQTSSSSSFRTVIAHTSFIIAQSSSAIKPFPYHPHVYTYTAP